jgi:hypothetical protein
MLAPRACAPIQYHAEWETGCKKRAKEFGSMLIALDSDDTYTRDPAFWQGFM